MTSYDHCSWQDNQLHDRSLQLDALAKIPHSEARAQEIRHELDCIAFEVGRRLVEGVTFVEAGPAIASR